MTIQPSPRSIEGGARHQDGTLWPYRRYLIGGGALILVLAAFYWWTHSGNQAGPRRTPIVPVQVATGRAGTPISVNYCSSIVVAPDGKSAYALGEGQPGSLTRVSVRLSGDLLVKIDKQSTEAADMLPGTSVKVTLPSAAVLVAART